MTDQEVNRMDAVFFGEIDCIFKANNARDCKVGRVLSHSVARE